MTNKYIKHPSVRLGKNCTIGNFTSLAANVVLGDNVSIGNNVTIYEEVRIGDRVIIGDNVILGVQAPESSSNNIKEAVFLRVDDDNYIGSSVIIYAGTKIGSKTHIRDFVCIKERCSIGDFVFIDTRVSFEEDVSVEKEARIYAHSYISAHSYIGEGAIIAPGVTMASNSLFIQGDYKKFPSCQSIRVEQASYIGINTTILPGSCIEPSTKLPACSLVKPDSFKI